MAEKLFDKQPVSFGARLAASQSFSTLFREGMKLVEETASYLDGVGRKDSKKLDRSSWLLLHRAVNEGEMSLAQANKEKTKVKLAADEPIDHNVIKVLPQQLRELIERSSVLHDKVRRLDATIHAPVPEEQATGTALDRQLGLLKAAFERQGEPHGKS
jgi:regulator of CtrA degradation